MTDKLNRCYFQAASSGTGDFVYASTVAGFVSPTDAGAVDTHEFACIAENGSPPTEWELVIGAYDAGTGTIARTTIVDSSNAGAAVTFSAAPKVRMGVVLAADFGASVTNPLTADLDVGGFAIIGLDGPTGGGVVIRGGASSDDTPSPDVNITGGDGPPSPATANAGSVILTGGTGYNGGEVSFQGGNGDVDGGTGGGFHFISGLGFTGGSGRFEAGFGYSQGGNLELIAGGNSLSDGAAILGHGGSDNGGSIELNPGYGGTDGGDLVVTLPAAGSGRQGLIIVSGLPTSDPGVSGALYSLSGAIMISP